MNVEELKELIEVMAGVFENDPNLSLKIRRVKAIRMLNRETLENCNKRFYDDSLYTVNRGILDMRSAIKIVETLF